MNKIKKTFPNLDAGFYEILCERLKAYDCSDENLEDCINNVIDTCLYPNPTVGHFISYFKERTCPFHRQFAIDFEQYAACDTCMDEQYEFYIRCKMARKKNK